MPDERAAFQHAVETVEIGGRKVTVAARAARLSFV
jgi:hypothetical protein